MQDKARQMLRDRQSRLVASLRGKVAAPDGFDAARVALAGATLVNKRQRAMIRCWPQLQAALGDSFVTLFKEYASNVPPPIGGQALQDTVCFMGFLQRRGSLPDAAALLWLRHRAHRRLFAIARLGESGAVVLAVRVLALGVGVFRWRRTTRKVSTD